MTCLALCLCSCDETKAHDVAKYTVEIKAESADVVRYGMGFVCGDIIVTAAHIFDEYDTPQIICSFVNMNIPPYLSTVIFIDRRNDVAVLTSPTVSDIRLAALPPAKSRPLFVADESEAVHRCKGRVKVIDERKPSELIELDAYLPKGTSGAPVYDDKGIVFGIIIAHNKDNGTTYAVGGKTISNVVDKANKLAAAIKVD